MNNNDKIFFAILIIWTIIDIVFLLLFKSLTDSFLTNLIFIAIFLILVLFKNLNKKFNNWLTK